MLSLLLVSVCEESLVLKKEKSETVEKEKEMMWASTVERNEILDPRDRGNATQRER